LKAAVTFHHVANGTCTTRLITAAGIPGTWSIWSDPLYEGPVPGNIDDAALVEVRARHLSGGEETPPADPVNDLRQWRAAIARHDAYDELVLWFEHDVFDQLNLIQLLTWLRDRFPSTKPVGLVCIGEFPGRQRFKGLGELRPDELRPLIDARARVSDAQYAVAARAWDAFRQRTPEALDAVRHTDTSALPYLATALTRFLQEYPWTRDGLSRTERNLLQLSSDGPIDLATVFARIDQDEQSYFVTDLTLDALSDALAGTSPPLLSRERSTTDGDRPLQGTVAITDAGRAVLSGRRDRVEMCGIDRWLGGVHLQGKSNVWRWDDARQHVVLR
jgi:hypothetical protein